MLHRSTVIVPDFLSERRVRDEAARSGVLGRQVMNLPGLAARLAGGFRRPASAAELRSILRETPAPRLSGLSGISGLPGFARAATGTLLAAWHAGLNLQEQAEKPGAHGRWQELALLEEHLRSHLPPGRLLLPELVGLALGHADTAAVQLGPVTLERLADVPPLYRPLLEAVGLVTEVRWFLPPGHQPAWEPRNLQLHTAETLSPRLRVEACADPAHEALTALRWARRLLSSGVSAADIAIGTTTPAAYDEAIQELAEESGLPLHAVHGRPALNTPAGQYAAAFAAALLHGPTQARIRRLVACAEQCGDERLGAFPEDWAETLKPDRLLGTLPHWQRELRYLRITKPNLAALIERLVGDLGNGPAQAAELGERWLSGDALAIWRHALSEGPAAALETSLARIRTAAAEDPATSIIWAPAAALPGWPRRHVRLLGLSARSWPRRSSDEDPLLPNRLLGNLTLRERSTARSDTETLHAILQGTAAQVVLSRPRRGADGKQQVPSPLLQALAPVREQEILPRDGTPHALTEADRRAARPSELAACPAAGRARAAFRYAFRPALCEHDGLVRPGHPAVRRAVAGSHSATSLKSLLLNPHAFVVERALGWNAPEPEEPLLQFEAIDRGSLLHDILETALNALGSTAVPRGQIAAACRMAAEGVAARWEARRTVPPLLVWQALQEELAELATEMLINCGEASDGMRSWAELRFGFEPGDGSSGEHLPWPRHAEVKLPGTDLQLRGVIDRLDLDETGRRVRVTDYKSGKSRKHDGDLDGGNELQRTIYGLVVKQLLGDSWDIEAGLLYADADAPLKLTDLDGSSRRLTDAIREAVRLLEAGKAFPGPGLDSTWEGTLLAHPATGAGWYLRQKEASLARVRGRLDGLLGRQTEEA